MKRETKSTLTPRLRFPEFRETWKVRPISEILEEQSRPIDLQPEKEYALVTVKRRYGGVVPREVLKGREVLVKSQFVVRPNDFLISKRQIIHNACGVVPTELDQSVVSNEYSVLTAKEDCHIEFFNYFSQQPSITKSFMHSSVGIVIEKMLFKLNVWLKLKFPFPTPAEQRKIAACLGSLDDWIGAEAAKVEALRSHKKGLMQQLFPRPGESGPRLRFRIGFSENVEWQTVELPDIVYFQEGPGIMAVDFRSEGVPLVRLAGLGGLAVTLDGCNYLDPEKVAQKWDHFKLATGDLLISSSASFGRPAIVSEAAAGAVFYTGLIRFRPKDERLSLSYLEAFLGSPPFITQTESSAVGSGIQHFGPTHLKQMQMPLPPLAEQQRIAACLSSLDDLLAAQSRKVEGLKAHKKGLMQQLFPSSSLGE
jgi:type I restriction enzyme S subunit